MKSVDLENWTVVQLVDRFAALAVSQFKAELEGDNTKYNRLNREIVAIGHELKNRSGDQRSALVALFVHPNAQVRLMAAELALAVAPMAARETLQALWDQKEFPQAAYAFGTLRALERGERKPT